MNISNFHFDTMLGLLAITLLEDLQVEKALAREFMGVLQPVRAHITTGYTVRSEMARKNVEKGNFWGFTQCCNCVESFLSYPDF